jgi:hypothetical protein
LIFYPRIFGVYEALCLHLILNGFGKRPVRVTGGTGRARQRTFAYTVTF